MHSRRSGDSENSSSANVSWLDAAGHSQALRGRRGLSGVCAEGALDSAGERSVEQPTPRVSIGVPVYNGARYIARTLDALVNQTFQDFEIIISDNGSTDETPHICRRYAAMDPRVRYVRSVSNQGVVRNFNRCFELARGEYFRWNAADDTCAPTLLERLVRVLDSDPDVVVAFARSLVIDDQDQPIRVNDYDIDADYAQAHVRFSRVININHRRHCAQEIYGLIRSESLRRTPLYEPCARTDSILLARLSLLGRFRRVDEPLFYNRDHAARSVRLVPGKRAAARSRLSPWIGTGPIPPPEFWNPDAAGAIAFPEWRIAREYARSVRLAELRMFDRVTCTITLISFICRHIVKLSRDAVIAIEHLALGHPQQANAVRLGILGSLGDLAFSVIY